MAPLLKPAELKSLLQCLRKPESLERIATSVCDICGKGSLFKYHCALGVLLSQNALSLQQAMAAYYMLYRYNATVGETAGSVNPFIPFLFRPQANRQLNESIDRPDNERRIHAILRHWTANLLFLDPSDTKLQKRTPQQVIADYDKELTIIFGAESPDITELQRVYAETAPRLPPALLAENPSVLYLDDPSGGDDPLSMLDIILEGQDLDKPPPVTSSDSPGAATPSSPARESAPTKSVEADRISKAIPELGLRGISYTASLPEVPMLPIHPSEYMWIGTMEHPSLAWDYSLDADTTLADSLRDIMCKAIKAPLTPPMQETLFQLVTADSRNLWTSGLSPQRFPELVENNPLCASECLIHVYTIAPWKHFVEYLVSLVNMDMSLHSMEVVNRLITYIQDLPAEFVRMYVSNCIASCESVKDKYVQNRLVRVVCVFLLSIMRHQSIALEDLFIEVQAFCIHFSRIREAAALFRTLKELDGSAAL